MKSGPKGEPTAMKTAALHRFHFFSTALLAGGLLVSAAAPAQQRAAGPSEATYASWVEISHQLEAEPLDPQVSRDAEVAVQEVAASPDFHTPLCSSFFTLFNKLSADGYPYQALVYRLYTLGSATYRIQTGKTDPYGTNLYAFTSVLKGYQSLIKKNPNAQNKTMEDLLLTDIKGKLEERLKKDSSCR